MIGLSTTLDGVFPNFVDNWSSYFYTTCWGISTEKVLEPERLEKQFLNARVLDDRSRKVIWIYILYLIRVLRVGKNDLILLIRFISLILNLVINSTLFSL